MGKKKTSRFNAKPRRDRRGISLQVSTPRAFLNIFFRKLLQAFKTGVVVIILLFAAYASFCGLRKVFQEADEFKLSTLTISPPPHKESFLNYNVFSELSQIKPGQNIFSFNLKDVENTLLTYPEIQKIQIERRLPGEISVKVLERIPLAKTTGKRGLVLMDGTGFCFSSQLAKPSLIAKLPVLKTTVPPEEGVVIQDIGLLQALNLVKLHSEKEYLPKLNKVSIKNSYSLQAEFEGNLNATFGYYDQARQLTDLTLILEETSLSGNVVSTANLIPFKNIPITFSSEKVPPKKRRLPEKKKGSNDLNIILNRS